MEGLHIESRDQRVLLNGPSSELPQSGRSCAFLTAGILSGPVAVSGLATWVASGNVNGKHDTGGFRGYDAVQLFSFAAWLLFGPLALAAGMKAALLVSKDPRTTQRRRFAIGGIMLSMSVIGLLLGYFTLHAREMLSCGYLWCYAAEISEADPKGFKTSVGSAVMLVSVFVGITGTSFFQHRSASARDEDPKARVVAAVRAHKCRQLSIALALLVGLPVMLVLTGLLPNTWENFTRTNQLGGMHSIRRFVSGEGGIQGTRGSETQGALMVTQNYHLSSNVVLKLYPDTILFYGFLEIIVLVAAVCTRCPLIASLLGRKMRGVVIGKILLGLCFCLVLCAFVFYWLHDHNYHKDGKYGKFWLETWARSAGVTAVMVMGLLLLPAAKSSPLLAAARISWESALWVHIPLGILFMGCAVLHVVLYFARFIQQGHWKDILPMNWLFFYSQNPVGGIRASDNWTVPVMSAVFWVALVCFGVLPWRRRKNWELFRYSHNWFYVLVPMTLWHATHAWYFVLPGMFFWMIDRVARYMNAMEVVDVRELVPHKVDCWTDPAPERPAVLIPECITKVSFRWPGQDRVHSAGMYVLVNLPQISSTEWHPFSLSSSPFDSMATVHIKSMGAGTFTHKLHELASKAQAEELVMNVQGPYGPYIDLCSGSTLFLVAGGIGVTPMVSAFRCVLQSARNGDVGALRRVHFLWSARSPAVFDIFASELKLETVGLPFEVKFSLYCSTSQGLPECILGPCLPGMPNFSEILREETCLGSCNVRACGPPPMVNACEKAAKAFGALVDFEPWSFVL